MDGALGTLVALLFFPPVQLLNVEVSCHSVLCRGQICCLDAILSHPRTQLWGPVMAEKGTEPVGWECLTTHEAGTSLRGTQTPSAGEPSQKEGCSQAGMEARDRTGIVVSLGRTVEGPEPQEIPVVGSAAGAGLLCAVGLSDGPQGISRQGTAL